MKYALKEARLQNPVLTNRNGIRGIAVWVSKHIFATPYDYKRSRYVDTAGIGGRKKLLPGEISEYSCNTLRSQQKP